MRYEGLLELESKRCFDFFWTETNTDKDSPGYGLTRDRFPSSPRTASIASVGFGLSAIPIGIERGWISKVQGYERALGTLETLLNNVEEIKGFFYHFLDIHSAKRLGNSEVSLIDTAIAICGALTVGTYFGGTVSEKAEELYCRINWSWYRDPLQNQFYMGYLPENGFQGWWDFYAEQLMVYMLAAASPRYPVKKNMFYGFTRHTAGNKTGEPFIHSWFGSLFTHQFTHAWYDFREKVDEDGVDWWMNSVNASKANKRYCFDLKDTFKTLGPNAWGLTACDGPWGYNGRYGTAPSAFQNDEHIVDGTVPPSGAAGSIVFIPDDAIEALQYYYESFPALWSRYGFKDAYNLDVSPAWFAEDVIGINKGITLLMIENYRTGMIWEIFMKNSYARAGMKEVGISDYKNISYIA